MHILVTAFACHPFRGSEPGNGWNHRTLAQRGHDVEIPVTRSEGGPAIEAERSRLGLGNLRVHLLDARPVPLPHVEARRLAGYTAWLRACGRYVRRLRAPDLAHHVTWGSLHFGPYLAGLDAPVVVGPVGGGQVADPRHRVWFDGEWRDEWVRTVTTSQLLLAFPGAHRTASAAHVFATNGATERALRRLGVRSMSLLLAEGVEEGFLAARHRGLSAAPVFVWVGSMVPRKARPAWPWRRSARLAPRLPGAQMVFVGDGRCMPTLRDRVAALGMADRVSLIGGCHGQASATT